MSEDQTDHTNSNGVEQSSPRQDPPAYDNVVGNGDPRNAADEVDHTKLSVDEKNGNVAYSSAAPHANGSSGKLSVDVEKSADEKKEDGPMVGFFEVLRYSSALDKLFMIIGSIGAVLHGIAMPMVIIVFGDMLDSFLDVRLFCDFCDNDPGKTLISLYNAQSKRGTDWYCDVLFSQDENDIAWTRELYTFAKSFNSSSSGNGSLPFDSFNQNKLLDEMNGHSLWFCLLGLGCIITSYLQVTLWALAAKRQAHKIRLSFFNACLKQNMGWYDTNPAGELSTRLADDVDKIENGIGDKIGTLVQLLGQTIACLVLGFYYGWLLTLVILACSPLIAIAAALMDWVSKSSTVKEQSAYAKAGGIAEEVLSAIRTVIAFGGEEKECKRYNSCLVDAKKFGIRKGLTEGLAMGAVMAIVFMSYALGFYVGTGIVLGRYLPELHENYTVGRMLIVFFCILIASFSLGQAGPSMKDIATARGAAYYVFNLIERVPEINVDSPLGEKPDNCVGEVEFKDVHFQYPSRPDVKVLQGLSLTVKVGQTVALVGSSGCGKSTTIQLVQRFYDACGGTVLLDGRDIKNLNVQWLRSNISVVSQEPILFATTIAENIRYGRDDVTHEEIVQAAKEANAHSFIERLPDKYETVVGSRGSQLSGGQKQRIAIARALVNSPKVLLLDEATSALDTESEAVVQEALEKASHGRTTIVIAHRLSTVQNADIIVAIKDGQVMEQGTHSELMAKKGLYASLVERQTKKESKHHQEDGEGAESSDTETEDELEMELQHELERTASKRSAHRQRSHSDVHKHTGSHVKSPERVLSVVSTNETVGDKDVESEKEKPPNVGFCELMSWNSPEWYFILLGCFSSLVVGGSQPAFAVVFSKILSTFISCDNEKMQDNANFFSLMFMVIALGMFVFTALEKLMFSLAGERLTERLRSQVFRAYLRQEISFHDNPDNSTGALTSRLATEVSAVQGATGSRLGGMFNALANLGVGIAIAFAYSWVLTLAILAFVPFLGAAGFVEMKVFRGGGTKNSKLYEESNKLATEAIENIRTVQSLRKEKLMYVKYETVIEKPYKKEILMTQGLGITYGFSQGIIFFAYAGLFTLGAWLIVDEPGVTKPQKIDFEAMMITFSAVVFGAMSLGQATSFAPNAQKGVEAAGRIKALFQSEPSIDSFSTLGDKPDRYEANVEFSNAVFHYPTRRTVKVLRGLNVGIEAGQTLALVGSSGCGKSTTIQLLERFYDTDSGAVLIGGADVKELNVSWLRKQLGIVSQEPVLFDRSIADNIRYGDNARDVSMEEVIEASKKANIHQFIESLPQGYETRVGDKGTQLSGGQKQRVAIARAMVRNPKILLLDEATSALDSESEAIVQQALDNASSGRTTIVIAHRLSTIQKADKIAVIRHGHVTEQGTHSELMALKGFYYKLQNIQKLQT